MSDLLGKTTAAAVKRVAERIGLGKVEPWIMSVSDHVVLRLSPAAVVARVRRGASAEEEMRRELAVARHLSERGAPVLPPLPGEGAGPYTEDGLTMTLWLHMPHAPADPENPQHRALASKTLALVHRAFADYPDWLPAFEEKLAFCRALLEVAPPALSAEDRRFLLAVHDEIVISSEERVPIHGDAGFHNILMTPRGPLWIDFEAACRGPRAWDFAALGVEEVPAMAVVRSFCVSAWCWAQADLPGKREAAEHHLSVLKGLFRWRLTSS